MNPLQEELRKEIDEYIKENVEAKHFNQEWLKLHILNFLSTSQKPYYNNDHTHCFQESNPPCGIKGLHRCCLCEKPVPKEPTSQRSEEDWKQCNPCFNDWHSLCVDKRCECGCKPSEQGSEESDKEVVCSGCGVIGNIHFSKCPKVGPFAPPHDTDWETEVNTLSERIERYWNNWIYEGNILFNGEPKKWIKEALTRACEERENIKECSYTEGLKAGIERGRNEVIDEAYRQIERKRVTEKLMHRYISEKVFVSLDQSTAYNIGISDALQVLTNLKK